MRAEDQLHGRDEEVARLRAALGGVDERGSCLFVHGDPGIGKSALVEDLADEARRRGLTVLATAAVPSEAHLPFAGLHQMLQPVVRHVADLPPAQRHALLGALGHGDADVHDEMAVALAGLTLVRDRAADSPVLVVIEDAQWLDRPTAEVLAFVARRIEADPVVVVATSRDLPADALAGVRFDEMALDGLDDASAGAIVDTHAPDLDPALRDRLVREAAGNALALVELAVAWRRLPAGTLVASLVPVTARLSTTFASRVDSLSRASRDLLLVAAVNEGDGLAEIVAGAARLGHHSVSHDDLAPAVDARLVEVGVRGVSFRHPLIRSTIHHRATPGERRAAHAALAAVVRDPDRVAWHRAAAAVGPDEAVADALEQAAARARRRGAVLVAVTALERAAALSPDPALRGRRLVQAAHHAHDLGRQDVVARLLDEAEPLDLDPVDRARAAWRRQALVDEGVGDPAQLRVLVAIVERLREAGDVDMALEFLIAVAGTAWRMGVGPEQGDLILQAAESLPVNPLDPRLINVLGLVAPVRRRAVVLERLPGAGVAAAGDPVGLGLLGLVAGVVGDQAAAVTMLSTSARGLRAQGRFGTLTNALVAQAWSAWQIDDWRTAAAAAAEAQRLGEQTDRPGVVIAARLIDGALAAVRGDVAAAEEATDEVDAVVRPAGATTVLALSHLVRGLALLAGGQTEAAYDVLAPHVTSTGSDANGAVSQGMLATYADVAVMTGRSSEARAVVDEIEAVLHRNGSPILAAALAYARPLVAEDDRAEALYVRAIDADLARWPFLRARARLAYGVWLRRRRRTTESRLPLRAAREAFDALGARPWSERARRELRAAGEASPGRPSAAADLLTAQELEIARLAASGLTNREIGQQLYLSHRTVGSHLYHVFPKLAITSRGELAAALGEAGR